MLEFVFRAEPVPPRDDDGLPTRPPLLSPSGNHMAIAVCSYCGGLVIMHATMCPHCGQRGEATPSRRRVSRFGKKQTLPLPVRRFIILVAVGSGAGVCLALANWMRPAETSNSVELAQICQEIEEVGEEEAGMLDGCKAKLAALRQQEHQ